MINDHFSIFDCAWGLPSFGGFMELFRDNYHSYQEAFGADDCSSPAMKAAIAQWLGLYYGGDGPLQLPYTIVRKLIRGIFAEYAPGEGVGNLPHIPAMELRPRLPWIWKP